MERIKSLATPYFWKAKIIVTIELLKMLYNIIKSKSSEIK